MDYYCKEVSYGEACSAWIVGGYRLAWGRALARGQSSVQDTNPPPPKANVVTFSLRYSIIYSIYSNKLSILHTNPTNQKVRIHIPSHSIAYCRVYKLQHSCRRGPSFRSPQVRIWRWQSRYQQPYRTLVNSGSGASDGL